MRKGLLFLTVAAVVTALDQITKVLVARHIPLGDSLPVIDGFFRLVHVRNPGVAFGFLAGADFPFRTGLLLVVSLAAMCIIIMFLRNLPGNRTGWITGLGLVFGGAVGNLIDRVRFGEVIDFLDFSIRGYHWPAFNVADSAVTVGAIALGLLIVFKRTP